VTTVGQRLLLTSAGVAAVASAARSNTETERRSAEDEYLEKFLDLHRYRFS
jgi:hypothetical protein